MAENNAVDSSNFADMLFTHGLYIPERIIYLGERVEGGKEQGLNADTAANVIKGLTILNSIDSKQPIRLYINNSGGDDYHGAAIIDAIRGSIAPVEGWVFGQAMSMAAFVFLCCAKRYMGRNAMLLFHSGTWDIHVDAKDVMPWAKENERILRSLKQLIFKRLRENDRTKTLKDAENIMKKETLITAKQAANLGFTHYLI